jgi:hypothetical protein
MVIRVTKRTTYNVRNAEGRLKAKHHRIDRSDGRKQIWWELPNGSNGLNGTPLSDLPLYGSELVGDCHEDDLIVMVEGEKARDALEAAGMPAVGTVTGASGTPGTEALEVLRDRRVCLWPDNDDLGRGHMERIAERLDGVAAEVLVYSWHESPEKGDAADHRAIQSKNPKAVDRLLTDLEGAPRWKAKGAEDHEASESTPTTPSTPIFGELPSATPFPVDALPVATRRFVREAAAAIGCPPEMIAVPLLGTLSAGIGASRVVHLKRGWQEGATLFLAVVGRPGTKKTPAAKAATAPAWERQAELRRRYRDEREVYEAECRQWKDGSSEESEDEESAPEPSDEPTLGRTVVEDTTTEALFLILEENPRGVLVGKDELTGWLRSMNQYKGGKGSDRQVWLSIWSNHPTVIDRKGKAEPIIVPRPFVSLVGSVQPDRLSELARGPDDGLWDRFLISYPELRRTRISDAEISDEASAEFKQLYGKLADLRMPEDESGEPYPSVVPLSSDAWEVFKEVADSLAEEVYAPGFPARLEGTWSKMEAYLARLALILALCRVAEQGGEERVKASDVVMASGLIDYFKAHAYRVHVGLHAQNPDDLLAGEVARFLQEHGGDWEGEPGDLWRALTDRGSESVPGRADELSKKVRAWASQGTWLTLGDKQWDK